ncbi:MAG: sugar kinase [Dethiobacter sp.]|jgi:2-dehydro-3-deoxygluconokinase|nr:sugar kinase [Dethiobacter sp.]
MKKVVTFGEIMLRLATPDYQRFVQAETFEATYGGGEANVAVSLAHFGLDSAFVTAVPDNDIGQAAINHLRRFGVSTGSILKVKGARLGIYFLESGASQRPSQVIYDRSPSAIAGIEENAFDWKAIFAGADWFHFTGITPALGDRVAEETLRACRMAKSCGLTVSCDLNYRKKLWSREKAQAVMSGLMPYVDVVVANEEDAEMVFGIQAKQSDIVKGTIDDEGYREVARELKARFDLKYVAITLRESISASENGWSGLMYDGSEFYRSRRYLMHIVDRVGGGDAFAGGLIYAFLKELSPRETVEFAAAASCLKHTVHGDFNMVKVSEVMTLAAGDESGRVQR